MNVNCQIFSSYRKLSISRKYQFSKMYTYHHQILIFRAQSFQRSFYHFGLSLCLALIEMHRQTLNFDRGYFFDELWKNMALSNPTFWTTWPIKEIYCSECYQEKLSHSIKMHGAHNFPKSYPTKEQFRMKQKKKSKGISIVRCATKMSSSKQNF